METDSVYAAPIPGKFYMSDHLKALYKKQSQCTYDALKLVSLDEIGLCLNESLHIGDVPKMSLDTILPQPFDNSDIPNVRNDTDCKDAVEIDTRMVIAQKELSHSVTFPCSGKAPLPIVSTDGSGGQGGNDTAATMKQASSESSESAHTRSISLPDPLILVSAMKGTREKLGAPRDKLSVTWAPDVYDPPPSAPSTAVIANKPRRKGNRKKNIDSKKNEKSKQKKKSSKGSRSKDKKPVQKYYRSTNAIYQSFEGEGKVVVESFDCGSTFLETSVTNLHFSLAEAT